MKNSYKQKLIDHYFNKGLTAKEKRDFDKLMESDLEFREYIGFEESIRTAIGQEDIIDFRRKISNTVRSKQRKNLIQKYTHKYWKYAATIVLFAGVSVSALFLINNQNNPDRLFKKAFNSSKIHVSRSPVSSASNATIVEAMLNYHEGNYYNAIGYFEQLLKQHPDNIAVRFYLGISQMETENYDEATDEFRYILSDQDNLYIEHAEWYLSLCFMKEDEMDKAINHLTIISQNPQNYYSEDAAELLKKLK
ncbi:MAG: tetratricopeptide repeat protein [Bacteroidota bacterium]